MKYVVSECYIKPMDQQKTKNIGQINVKFFRFIYRTHLSTDEMVAMAIMVVQ